MMSVTRAGVSKQDYILRSTVQPTHNNKRIKNQIVKINIYEPKKEDGKNRDTFNSSLLACMKEIAEN